MSRQEARFVSAGTHSVGAGSFLPDDFSISCSIRLIALLASSRRLRLASHRGNSGSAERRDKAIKIGAVPMKNIVSQPNRGTTKEPMKPETKRPNVKMHS